MIRGEHLRRLGMKFGKYLDDKASDLAGWHTGATRCHVHLWIEQVTEMFLDVCRPGQSGQCSMWTTRRSVSATLLFQSAPNCPAALTPPVGHWSAQRFPLDYLFPCGSPNVSCSDVKMHPNPNLHIRSALQVIRKRLAVDQWVHPHTGVGTLSLSSRTTGDWPDGGEVFVNYTHAGLPQLKDLIKEAVKENEAGGQHQVSYSPRTTSLSVSRAQTQRDAAEERFFRALDAEVIPCPAPA